MNTISLKHLTKKYAPNIGCFDINIEIDEGEVYGFIGPNGAGKTTVIRQMMGFIKSDSGSGTILGYDVWKESAKIMESLGYLAGEISLPAYMTGEAYLKMMASLRPEVKWDYVQELIDYFDLRSNQKIGKMSKGNKQKVAIINAFMHKPKILILDEPTTGLDPLMQEKFKMLVTKAKKRGTTIFISSHFFGEIEVNCDRVGFIKKGRLISEVVVEDIRLNSDKIYEIKFGDIDNFKHFIKINKSKIQEQHKDGLTLEIKISQQKSRDFLLNLNTFNVISFREIPFNLESKFLQLYADEVNLHD